MCAWNRTSTHRKHRFEPRQSMNLFFFYFPDKTETHAIDLSTHDTGPSNQRKNPSNNTCAPGRLVNSVNNFNPSSSHVQNNLGNGPSNAQENNLGYGSSNLGNSVSQQGSENYPEMSDPGYERWHALRHKHSYVLNF